nr:replication protein A 70 kDa DNA-binding subunit D-like [Ipomoea batatas]
MGMYSLATGLSTFNNRSAIKVRVIRSYLVREKKASADLKSQELVLHDPREQSAITVDHRVGRQDFAVLDYNKVRSHSLS